MMTEVWKILITCLLGAAVSLVLKQKSAEYAFLIAVATGIIALSFVVNAVTAPLGELSQALQKYDVETKYFKVALKAVGISFLTDFIADTCRDAGQSSMASKAELVGKTAIFILSVPIILSVLETAVGFIK